MGTSRRQPKNFSVACGLYLVTNLNFCFILFLLVDARLLPLTAMQSFLHCPVASAMLHPLQCLLQHPLVAVFPAMQSLATLSSRNVFDILPENHVPAMFPVALPTDSTPLPTIPHAAHVHSRSPPMKKRLHAVPAAK